jgi:hypothetical protein
MRFLRPLLLFALGLPLAAQAQTFSDQQIDQLTAQVALYPDSLLSQVLMASTYPADVAEAAAWSRANSNAKGDEAVKMVEDKPWDTSVQSLVAFPQVIIMMGEKPEWVKDLGDAFLAQPEDVMDSVQRLRARARDAGNLASNNEIKVIVEQPPPTEVVQKQIIVIQPAQPQVVFVPTYNPTVVFGPWPPAYPPFWIPPPPGFWFSSAVATGIAWGVGVGVSNALWGGVHWGWGRSNVNINVNRYNNININRPINVNSNNINWNHNVNNRRNVAYRGGDATRQALDRRAQAGSREQYRGRDDSRARAVQTMQDRGVNFDASSARDRAQNVDRSQLQNRAQNVDRSQIQNRAQGIDRSQLQSQAANIDRSQVQNRAQSVDRSQIQNRAQNVDRSQIQNRAQSVDRSQLQSQAANIDRSQLQNRAQSVDRSQMQQRASSANVNNALAGAGDRNARAQIDRGAASRQAMQQRPQMQHTGGGGSRPQIQRPSGGGGGGGRQR